ncbi:hypothetical protein [Cupriavidus basilensis]|uniref:Phage protein n=1 Tax=Cupriavidus basilensis TaxID=68895 RepID=A0A0C4Y1C1_9BURK|nr:hypothetical protein [Cupriavidus basilensis]AJG18842.1 Phage protein [Cupriavidus basilensis]
MRTQGAQYSNAKTAQIGQFVEGLRETQAKPGTFDSAAADEFVAGIKSQSNGIEIPQALAAILEELPAGQDAKVIKGVLDGVASFEAQHGVAPTADVIEWALHQGYATTEEARKKYSLDSASSTGSDPLSLQPNRAVIAITAALAEAIPVANYLPADIGSNEAKLVIVSHTAGNLYGGYAQDQLMDGVNSGDSYISSARVHALTLQSSGADTGSYTGILTQVQATPETCDQAATPVKLMRGRLIVYVNGLPVAFEVKQVGSPATAPISGSIVIAGTTYNLAGTVAPDTGVVKVTPSSALPANTPVVVEGFIDYERSPGTTPVINTNATPFQLFASPWRVLTEQTIDARTQFSNELGLDPAAESMLAVRYQASNERHYDVLRKALRIGSVQNVNNFDFGWAAKGVYKSRAAIWQDFSAVLGAASQKMAEDTIDHGITHLYVPINIVAQWQALPADIFEPSGILAKPGIYRVGRLFGMYEVYYSPKVVVGAKGSATATILAIGRSSQVARCPFVLGDAVPPTVNPTPFTREMMSGSAFYARQFTSVNPHVPSAFGCAVFNVTNLF